MSNREQSTESNASPHKRCTISSSSPNICCCVLPVHLISRISRANSSPRLSACNAHTRSVNFHYMHQAPVRPVLLCRASADVLIEHLQFANMRGAFTGLCVGITLLLNSGFVVLKRQDSSSALGSIFRTRCAARCLSLHSTRIALFTRHFQVEWN